METGLGIRDVTIKSNPNGAIHLGVYAMELEQNIKNNGADYR